MRPGVGYHGFQCTHPHDHCTSGSATTSAANSRPDYEQNSRHPFHRCPHAEEQRRIAPELDVIFGQLDREAFLRAPNLRWYHFIGIGFDSVLRKVPEFESSGVAMTNARETHVIPMAEYTLG